MVRFDELEGYFGKTEAPKLNPAFVIDQNLSVPFALDNIILGAQSKDFNLKELLPPSCFESKGRILKPQFREMLARMNIKLTDEYFRRLWEE